MSSGLTKASSCLLMGPFVSAGCGSARGSDKRKEGGVGSIQV